MKKSVIAAAVSLAAVTLWASLEIPASAPDFNEDSLVNLGDFLLFAKAYNSTDPLFDLNENSVVDIGDLVIFVRSFGRPLP